MLAIELGKDLKSGRNITFFTSTSSFKGATTKEKNSADVQEQELPVMWT